MADPVQTVRPTRRERACALAERHRTSAARRRTLLARDEARGAPPEALDKHRAAIVRLEALAERALTTRDALDLDAKLAREKAASDERDLAAVARLADRVVAFGAGLRRAREKAEAGKSAQQRRRDRQLHRRPPTARDREVESATKLVDDPYRVSKPYAAPINRKVDVLEEDRANKRITVSQYQTGRMVQAVFERASGARLGGGGFEPSGSKDQTIAHELAIIYRIDDAETVRKLVSRVERAVGTVGARLLRDVLAGGLTLRQYAEARGKAGERGLAQVGGHFRLLLEGLDESFAARGLLVLGPEDKHDRRAAAVEGVAAGPHRRTYATPAPRGGEETDREGRVVPAGHGYRWGRAAT